MGVALIQGANDAPFLVIGMIIDAALVAAPRFSKNEKKEMNTDMQQSVKDNHCDCRFPKGTPT
jgi:hypothetical protein